MSGGGSLVLVRFMAVVLIMLSLEAIPIGAVISSAFDRSLPRRPRFWLRVSGVVIAMMLPMLVAIVAPVGEQATWALIWVGLGWGLLLFALSRFLLFHGTGFEPGSADDDGDGPGPEDDRPTPPAPIGGIPPPDARPPATRVRDDHLPRPSLHPRRPVRERKRRVPHLRPLRSLSPQRPA